MLIISLLYIGLVWLLVSRLKIVRWGWASGGIIGLIGVFILCVFLGLFNYLTPAGRFVIVSRVVEVTPNVSGQVVELNVQANMPIKSGSILFRLDDAPFKAKVAQLEAALVQARQNVRQLEASHSQAKANVESVSQQLDYYSQRLTDLRKLASTGSQAEFRVQDTEVQYATTRSQLQAAQAVELGARLAVESLIGGQNTSVAQIEAQLENAKWELEQTTVRAPADGFVSTMALAVGARALQARSVMSFIVEDDLALVGFFQPNGFRTVQPGAKVVLLFDQRPGHLYHANILEIPKGVGQGQISVSGQLARVGSIGGAHAYPVLISVPADFDKNDLRLGMPGSAWVIAEDAGVIGLIMSILAWVSSYVAFL